MNILFLDDNTERLASAERFISKVMSVPKESEIGLTTTANDTIDAIQTYVPQILFLDHDLGGEVYVDSGREDCGMEVVRWLVGNFQENIKVIIVHSWNTVAGEEMVKKLRDAGYSNVHYIPFRG